MIEPDAALPFCRFAFDSAAFFLWGAACFLGWLAPPRLSAELSARLRSAQAAASIAAALAALAFLPVKTALYGDGWGDAVDPASLGAVIGETMDGRIWIAQAVAAALLCVVTILPRLPSQKLVASAAGLCLLTLCFTGHSAIQDGGLGLVHRIALAAHLLSAGAWFGALVPVLLALSALRPSEHAEETTLSLARFSQVGHIAVVVAITSGAANVYFVTGRLPLDWSLPYERLLALKIALVAIMIGLALANRYLFVPRLHFRTGRSLSALKAGALAEIALGLIVLALVSWFGTLDPMGSM